LGLDIVELVAAVEDEFSVQLSDKRLNRMRTVGELHGLVVEALKITDEEERNRLWSRLLDVIEKDTGVDRERLLPSARFVDDLGLD
jgi:acyl carrier protein